jgi:hypothetical protein
MGASSYVVILFQQANRWLAQRSIYGEIGTANQVIAVFCTGPREPLFGGFEETTAVSV